MIFFYWSSSVNFSWLLTPFSLNYFMITFFRTKTLWVLIFCTHLRLVLPLWKLTDCIVLKLKRCIDLRNCLIRGCSDWSFSGCVFLCFIGRDLKGWCCFSHRKRLNLWLKKRPIPIGLWLSFFFGIIIQEGSWLEK